jgi:XTP/dITP diphosphohydrolase
MPGQTGLKRILIATGNAGKLKEFRHMLGSEYEVLGLADIDFEGDIVEDAETFSENALIKARVLHAHTGLAVLADDSGLEVDFLNGAPGVRTARYAGENATSEENITKLMGALKDVDVKKRGARFQCALAWITNNSEEFVFEGSCDGAISETVRGAGGFGYDPVFIPSGFDISFAEMTGDEKKVLSHRGKALMLFSNHIK